MNTSDRFLRFAAECEVMAKFSPTPENRAVWSGLAERWIRCAKLMDHQDSNDHRSSVKRSKFAALGARLDLFGFALALIEPSSPRPDAEA